MKKLKPSVVFLINLTFLFQKVQKVCCAQTSFQSATSGCDKECFTNEQRIHTGL